MPPSISMGGGAFLFPYQVGVLDFLLDHFDTTDVLVIGTSGGVYPSVPFALGKSPAKWMERDFPKCMAFWKSRWMKLFLDDTSFQKHLWAGFLPADAYKIFSRKLLVNCSVITSSGMQAMVHQIYNSNEHLIDCIVASGHLPFVYRHLTRCDGTICFDGALANPCPKVDTHDMMQTVSVSPFPSRADICPSKHTSNSFPHFLEVPTSMEACREVAAAGYRDAHAKMQLFIDRGWRPKPEGGHPPLQLHPEDLIEERSPVIIKKRGGGGKGGDSVFGRAALLAVLVVLLGGSGWLGYRLLVRLRRWSRKNRILISVQRFLLVGPKRIESSSA